MRKSLLIAVAALAALTAASPAFAADVTTAAEASAARAAGTAKTQSTQAAADAAAATLKAENNRGAPVPLSEIGKTNPLQPKEGFNFATQQQAQSESNSKSAAAAAAADADPSNMAGKGFTLFTSEVTIIGKTDGISGSSHAGINNINNIAKQGVRLLMIGLSLLCTVMIVAGGIVMATAGGNTERISKGKRMLGFSLAGLALALSSYLIISLTGWLLEAK